MDWKEFKILVTGLSDGKDYFLIGRIMYDNDVVFYLPFESTVRDFALILRSFREKFSVTDSSKFRTYIQPVRYELNGN